ncbi:Bug family tripartite tricarboxylate transporter substrate binding protein [Falsiroseomonas oryzae]|uniref:Bug family tripartite tricarboxylate transporter substrate binding protein n=1 Tax=Falsiroseomonas oryzae TaxID=2766473 RepID=UPI0022EA61F4|nr:tripartite tricarboxylate transporter substrate binding protein [Roseomonas sp. MO-31]
MTSTPATRRATLALGFSALAMPALAQAPWPTRSLRFIVPFGVGGTADIIARTVAQRLQEPLGQSVVVENRTGGGGVIGTDSVVKSAPDGYTFIIVTSTQSANETLIPNRPYDLLRDLAPVSSLNLNHLAVVVHPSLPVNSIPELIAHARANPGRLDCGNPGIGSGHHLAAELFRMQAGVDFQHIPFRSSDQMRTAIVGGQVQLCFDPIPSMLETIRTGRVRAIGATGPAPSPVLPGVATVAAVLPGYEQSIWVGLMAPARTPPAILDRLHAEIGKVLADPAIRESQERSGGEAWRIERAAFGEFVRRDVEQLRTLIRTANIQAP